MQQSPFSAPKGSWHPQDSFGSLGLGGNDELSVAAAIGTDDMITPTRVDDQFAAVGVPATVDAGYSIGPTSPGIPHFIRVSTFWTFSGVIGTLFA